MAGEEGYDCDFVEPPPRLIQSECSICLLVLREPHLISCCGHNFCRPCIETVIKNKKPCPLCQQCVFTTLHNKGLERSLKELVVTCEEVLLGCNWRGELGKMDAHLKEACPYVELRCRYVDCDTVAKRQDMPLHETACKFRPYGCEHCASYASTFDDVVNVHWSVCPKYPVPCPNKCDRPIERQLLQHHVDGECPLTSVICEFSYAGCQAKVLRKDVQSHLSTDILPHLSMVSNMNRQLLLSNRDLSEKVVALEASAGEQKAKIMALEAQMNTVASHLGVHNKLFPVRVEINVPPGNGKPVATNALLQQCDFYSHLGGYKMQLRVNARDNQYQPNLYLGVHMMRGEYDTYLKWPFNGSVVVFVGEGKRHVIDFRNAAPNLKSRVLQGAVADVGFGPAEPVCQWNVFFVQPLYLLITVNDVMIP